MKQIDPFSYSVDIGEVISIVWSPVGHSGGRVFMEVTGASLKAVATGDDQRFEFVARRRFHRAKVQATFPAGISEGARFESLVMTSNSSFVGPTITHSGQGSEVWNMFFDVEDWPDEAPDRGLPASWNDDYDQEERRRLREARARPAYDYVVWFGTHRKPLLDAEGMICFGTDRDQEVHYGTCRVTIPRSHSIGSIGSSWVKRVLRGTDDRLRVASIGVIDEDAYWRDMAAALQEIPLPDRHAVVFLHGFNVSFEQAAVRSAQIGFDLKVSGVMAFYSWPSKASLKDYTDDEATIGASVGFVSDYLCKVAERSQAAEVHVIAHSMGNRALLHAADRICADAQRRSGVRFSELILAAPDVDVDEFRDLAKAFSQVARHATLYVCNKDRAVEASRWLHGFARVGLMPPVFVAAGMDTVSASDVDLTILGHGYVASTRAVLADIHEVIFDKKPPAARFSIRSTRTKRGEEYWVIRR